MNELIKFGVYFLILFAPLAFGCTPVWAFSVLEIIIFSLGFLYLSTLGFRKRPMPVISLPVFNGLFIAAVFLFILFISAQLIPVPILWIKVISPKWFELFNRYHPDMNFLNWTAISIYPYATLTALLKLTSYFTLFFLVCCSMRREDVKPILYYLLFIGLAIGCLGFVQKNIKPDSLYGFIKVPWYAMHPYGTFFSKNHFAGFESLCLIPFLAIIQIYQKQKKYVLSVLGTLLFFIGFMLMVYAGSSGGIIAFIAGVSFFYFLLLVKKFHSWDQIVPLVLLIVFSAGAVMTAIFFWQSPFQALIADFADWGQRPKLFSDGLLIIKDFPIMGVGLGCFRYIFPLYQTFKSPYVFHHVENEYIEMIIECGFFGLIFMVTALICYLWFIYRILKKESSETALMAIGMVSAMTAILIHNLVNFNFHIPANMVLFTVYSALIFKLSLKSKKDVGHE